MAKYDANRVIWAAYAALVGLALVAYPLLPTGGVLQSAFYDLVGVTAIGAMLLGVRLHAPRSSVPWLAFAVGTALAVGGDTMWTLHAAISGGDPPFPWYADAVYLASYPVLAYGALALLRQRRAERDMTAVLDALVVAVGLGSIVWVYLIQPNLNDGSLGSLARLVAASYPAMDLLLLGVAARFASAGGLRRPTVAFLLLGMLLMLGADVVYGAAVLNGAYHSGALIDIGWIAAYSAFGLAALHPSMAETATRVPVSVGARLSPLRLLALAGVALSGPCVLTIRQLQGQKDDVYVIATAAAALFLLSIARVSGLALNLETALRRGEATEARLRESEGRFRSAFADAPIGMALVGRGGCWLRVNRALCEMLGYDERELVGRPVAYITHVADRDGQLDQRRLEHGEIDHYTGERRFVRKDLRIVRTIVHASVAGASEGGEREAVCQVQDVTLTRALEDELRFLAVHDPLTGLPNRTLFRDRLDHALAPSRVASSLAVLFLDLDRFKVINDGLGHDAGDKLLIGVAKRLRSQLRERDTLARFGGDEFVALLDGIESAAEASRIADRMVAVMTEPFDVGGQETFVGVSVGVVIGCPGHDGADDLIRSADVALYQAKAAGRATSVVFDPEMRGELARRLAAETDLRRALERGEFLLHYQPIVDLHSGTVRALEALLRWAHPARGLTPPIEFIAMIEETGMIVPVGAWVLGEACRQVARWRAEHPHFRSLVVNVNVSPRQLRDAGLVNTVRDALDRAGLPPDGLCLELTERSLIGEAGAAMETLRELRDLGVSLAIDDFGAGYSSLDYLHRLPVHGLKVDRSFVARISQDGGSEGIVQAVLGLARGLGLTVTAEGIESPDQLGRLRALGCDLGQGYLLGRPANAEAAEAMIVSTHDIAAVALA